MNFHQHRRGLKQQPVEEAGASQTITAPQTLSSNNTSALVDTNLAGFVIEHRGGRHNSPIATDLLLAAFSFATGEVGAVSDNHARSTGTRTRTPQDRA